MTLAKPRMTSEVYTPAQRTLGSCVQRAELTTGQRLEAYERVSTARQGAGGLGLEAQRKVIDDFAASRGADVPARFTEVESGRKADRPELAKGVASGERDRSDPSDRITGPAGQE